MLLIYAADPHKVATASSGVAIAETVIPDKASNTASQHFLDPIIASQMLKVAVVHFICLIMASSPSSWVFSLKLS